MRKYIRVSRSQHLFMTLKRRDRLVFALNVDPLIPISGDMPVLPRLLKKMLLSSKTVHYEVSRIGAPLLQASRTKNP